jgi:hypothetical protein
VFENRMLRRTFGPKRDSIIGSWRKVHNEELHIFLLFARCNWNDQVKEDEMDRKCSTSGREEECLQGVGGNIRWKEATSKT